MQCCVCILSLVMAKKVKIKKNDSNNLDKSYQITDAKSDRCFLLFKVFKIGQIFISSFHVQNSLKNDSGFLKTTLMSRTLNGEAKYSTCDFFSGLAFLAGQFLGSIFCSKN